MNVPHPLPALYWRWRQRRLSVRTWVDLAAELPGPGARIAIVGNAGYLRDASQGSIIDEHDVVVRMNNFRVSGFEQAVGSRVDVYLSNFYVPDIDFSNPDIARARYVVSSRPNVFKKPKRHNLDLRYGEHITAGAERIGARTVYVPTLSYVEAIASRLHDTPTTGLMAILLATDFLLERGASLYLTGFSFFEGKAHYFREGGTAAFRHHNLPSEKAILAERLAPWAALGRVACDEVVAGHLGLSRTSANRDASRRGAPPRA